MKKFFLFIIILIMFLFFGCKKNEYQYNNVDWLMFRGNNCNGISEEKGWNPKSIKNDKNIIWDVNVGQGYSSVTIKGNNIYTIGYNDSKDTVSCLNISDGSKIWSYSYDCKSVQYNGSRSTPTYDNDKIYTVSSDGLVLCLGADEGKVIWQKNLLTDYDAKKPTWGFAGSAVIFNDMLLLNACKSGIALNKNTGELIWKSESGICGYATPVIFKYNDIDCTVLFGEKNLFVVDIKNGNVLGAIEWQTSYDVNAANPIVKDNKIFISSGYNRGCALFEITDNGLQKIWENKEIRNHFSSSILLNDKIYAVDGNTDQKCSLKCIDFNTGNKLWSVDNKFSSILFSDNKIISISISGTITIFELTESGVDKLIDKSLDFDIYWTAPVLCRGMLFIRNQKGDLYCFDMKK